MRCLLDTQIFIWWMEENKKLPAGIKSIIDNPQNDIFLSVVTPWEILIKIRAKKLKVPRNFAEFIMNGIFQVIPIQIAHVLEVGELPLHHKDPFDRILISQTKVEGFTLVTSDKKFKKYNLSLISV